MARRHGGYSLKNARENLVNIGNKTSQAARRLPSVASRIGAAVKRVTLKVSGRKAGKSQRRRRSRRGNRRSHSRRAHAVERTVMNSPIKQLSNNKVDQLIHEVDEVYPKLPAVPAPAPAPAVIPAPSPPMLPPRMIA